MTPNQIKIAEKIILHIKKDNSSINKSDIWKIASDEDSQDVMSAIDALVEDYGLLRKSDPLYKLTKGGANFISFENIFDEKKQGEEKEAIDFEKAKIDLILNKWLLKTRWLPHMIAAVSVAISLYVLFAPDNKYIELERRIKVLEKQIKEEKAQTGKSIMSTGSVKSAVIEKSQTTPNP